MSSNYIRTQRDRARQLRNNQTPAERALWYLLRKDSIDGLRFRRQHPIGEYIADFACIDAKLVVEIDGASHDNEGTDDANRTAYIETRGFTVIRFDNRTVLANTEGVYEMISQMCRSKIGSKTDIDNE